jgi:hypothetical protein
MLHKINIENILFLDIETVPIHEYFNDVDDTLKVLWEKKTEYQRRDEHTTEEFYDRAGIWAEFEKILLR